MTKYRRVLEAYRSGLERLACRLFVAQFSDTRWTELTERGNHMQRPLWTSTLIRNPAFADRLYVHNLMGPDTVNTLPETTTTSFEVHGTVDRDVDNAAAVLARPLPVGVDMDDLGRTLEDQGVASFYESFAHVLDTLNTKARQFARR